MNVLELFPTAVGLFDLGRDLTETELKFLKNQKTTANIGNTTTVKRNLLEEKKLNKLKNFITASIDEYFKTVINPVQDTSLRITQSWCNYSEKDQWHHQHSHPNSFISGVFYVQASKGQDKIFFHRKLLPLLRTPPKEWNPYNSETWWVEVYTGRLVIFPSSLEHRVDKVCTNETRISLSFNTFPTGNFGDDSSLTGLKL